MKSIFRKYLVGLSVFVFAVSLGCSKRESSTANTSQASIDSYNGAQSTLQSIGLAISIPKMVDFADTTGTNTAALTSVFGGNDTNTTNFDSTKFTGLESAISGLQSSLSSFTQSPKNNLSLNPNLVTQSWQNSDLAYIHFLLGYYYTVHAVLKLRVFIGNIVQVVEGTRYSLIWDTNTLNTLADSGRKAILDAYFMLNGKRYKTSNQAGNGTISADKNLPAGETKCASYHLDQAIYYGGQVFPQLKTALEKLNSESFEAFFTELADKMTALGITELATD